jgi:hypothetical protein
MRHSHADHDGSPCDFARRSESIGSARGVIYML